MARKHTWEYANTRSLRVGGMVCTHCHKPILSGDFRYRETDEAYKPQHRTCSESDSGWVTYDEANAEPVRKPITTFVGAAEALKEAFFEGFDSYATQAAPYNSPEEAWEESEAKRAYDSLMAN